MTSDPDLNFILIFNKLKFVDKFGRSYQVKLKNPNDVNFFIIVEPRACQGSIGFKLLKFSNLIYAIN